MSSYRFDGLHHIIVIGLFLIFAGLTLFFAATTLGYAIRDERKNAEIERLQQEIAEYRAFACASSEHMTPCGFGCDEKEEEMRLREQARVMCIEVGGNTP